MNLRKIEFVVGIFIIVAVLGIVNLAVKVSGVHGLAMNKSYVVKADFSNVGDLKPGAPVKMGGVRVGQVHAIELDPQTFDAEVILYIDNHFKSIPADSSASIYTQGLLGSSYISLEPGFDEQVLKNDSMIQTTHSAVILEHLIGKFLYSVKSGS